MDFCLFFFFKKNTPKVVISLGHLVLRRFFSRHLSLRSLTNIKPNAMSMKSRVES